MNGRTPHRHSTPEADAIARLSGVEQLEAYLNLAHRLRDTGDVEFEIDILRRGINAASIQGRLQHKLQFFTELRRIYLNDRERGHLKKSVLWYYKWIINAIIQHSEIPWTTVESIFADMEDFYVAEGAPLRPVWKFRCVAAMYSGRRDEEEEWFNRWDSTPRTEADDCEACEWGFRAERFVAQGRYSDALEISKPITSTRNWCSATPEVASLLLSAAMRCRMPGLARWLAKVSARAVRRRDSLLDSLGHHIAFRAVTNEFHRSRHLAIVGLHMVRQSRNDRKNTMFYRAMAYWAALATLQTKGKMTLPANLFGQDTLGPTVSISDVVACSLQHAMSYATALDKRNGTDFYGQKVIELENVLRKRFSDPSTQ